MNSDDKILSQPEAALQAPEAEDPHTTEEAVASTDNPQATSPAAQQPTAESIPSAPVADEAGSEEVRAEPVQPGPTDEELFLAALEGEVPLGDEHRFRPPQRGQIVTGTVTSKTDSEILVDIGTKSEGVIAGRELEMLGQDTLDAIQIGQDVNVYILTPENREGHPQLSLRRAMEEQDWHDAEQYMQSGKIYASKVAGYNKGGLIVPFGKVRGFVPASQISQNRRRGSSGSTPDQRWAGMVGDTVNVKVIEVDRRRNRLILSELAADEELRVQRRTELLASLEVGQVHHGRVISLADFGAFVDLGGVDGLVHLSELSWRPISHPREVLKVGDEVEVEIINIDRERQRIGLSYKRCLEDPWDTLAAEFHVGQLVQGTITKMTKFGAFARLVDRPEIEGLIHISELAEHRVKHPREVVREDEIVTLRILRIDPDNRRLGLSLKQVSSEDYMDNDWRDALRAAETGEAATAAVAAPEPEGASENVRESRDAEVSEGLEKPETVQAHEPPTGNETR